MHKIAGEKQVIVPKDDSQAWTVLKYIGGGLVTVVLGGMVTILGWTANKILTHDTRITTLENHREADKDKLDRLDTWCERHVDGLSGRLNTLESSLRTRYVPSPAKEPPREAKKEP